MPADETLTDAREALAYWRRREASLGWHRRAARAEARDHVARWHAHVQRAQLERFGLAPSHPLAPLVGALGLPRGELARRLGTVVMGTRPGRIVRRLVAAATLAACVMAVLGVVAIVRLVS